jgi:hypothetical protein
VRQRVLQVLWPAFIVAGVFEALVFAVVDPRDLRWFGGPAIDWAPVAIYSVTFLMLWAAISISAAMTALLALESDAIGTPGSDSAR